MTVSHYPMAGDPLLAGPTAAQGQVARKYQEEIFQQAQKGNVIAYLRTGSGKTLISVLLIRWMATQEKARGKLIVFFVPKVSLVEQQAKYIEGETGLRVDRLHGALAMSFADRQGWKKKLESHDVVVTTPQLFLELITHSLWSISKVSLMVFDECHHARKNHPYNGIMREYTQVKDTSQRPKIFGMTASPYWNDKNPSLSLSTLEANLQCKIVGVHEHAEELQSNFSHLDEVIQQYPYPPVEYEEFPKPSLYETVKIFYVNSPEVFDGLGIPWLRMEMRYYMTLNNLGPYCASLYLFSELRHYLSSAASKANDVLAAHDDDDAAAMKVDDADLHVEIFDILDILDDFSSFFECSDNPNAIPIDVPLSWVSPKVRILVELILKHQKKEFQCIIFVEQRQIAFTLAKVLERMPGMEGLIRTAHLVGQGTNVEGVSNQVNDFKGDPIKLFREKKINVLIATSVAEEGLDFPECDLVFRFDALQHLVGYVQSRGRARSKASKYIIMIQQDNLAQLERYYALQQGESRLNITYHNRSSTRDSEKRADTAFDDPYDNVNPMELAERDRIVIPSTGAVLTYDNAMGLLSHLCALIPRDAFTPSQKPVYTGDFQCRLQLPASLPLEPKHLAYIGYPKHSKKEAKRSVAFLAVKHLLRLNVFNEYLLPVSQEADSDSGEGAEEVDSQRKQNHWAGSTVPLYMDVLVKDPWYLGEKLWVHQVLVDGKVTAGLVTGTSLPAVEVYRNGRVFELCEGRLLGPEDLDAVQCPRLIMNEFTKWCIWNRNTAKPVTGSNSFFVVPLTQDGRINFDAILRLLEGGRCTNWSEVSEDMYDHILVFCRWELGRTYRLKRTRTDVTAQSPPPIGSEEAAFATWGEYFVDRWSRKKKRAVAVSREGSFFEVVKMRKSSDGEHPLGKPTSTNSKPEAEDTTLLPQSECSWVHFPLDLSDLFGALPILVRRITDVYRARAARLDLRLPSIADDLLVEALTLPTATRCFNNQRLETLGDAVLEVCTTIQLLNQYPNRHEGQLSSLRQQYISNKYLLNRAKEFNLEVYLSSEVTSVYQWRYTSPAVEVVEEASGPPLRRAAVTYPRRNLQDCMEALLGASYLQGGLNMALQTGAALGLNFGGTTPWSLRYHSDRPEMPVSPLFTNLQDKLGYVFRWNHLLVEAVTHPSFASTDGTSYQRLEFLGDAILNLVVVDYLYKKFPTATSHELTYLRAKVVCSSTLAFLAITKLDVHKVVLANSMSFWSAMDQYVPILATLSTEEIVRRSWRYDPPKAISDVFEAIVGAVLVDSGYDFERTSVAVEVLMEEVLGQLNPKMATNPVSELVEWGQTKGCRKILVRKNPETSSGPKKDGTVVMVHDTIVSGPVVATSIGVSRFIAAERALAILSDPEHALALPKICECSCKPPGGEVKMEDGIVPGETAVAVESTVAATASQEDDSDAQMAVVESSPQALPVGVV